MSILNRLFGKKKSTKKAKPRPATKKAVSSKKPVAKKAAAFIAKSSPKKKA